MHRKIPPYLEANDNQLLKTQNDVAMYQTLVELLSDLKDARPIQTIKKQHLDMLEWIYLMTPKLIDSEHFTFDISTRCRWILSGRSDFPICTFCGKPFGHDRNMPVRYDYSDWCSNKCRQTDPIIVARTKSTKFRNHGDENYCNVEKAKQTFYDHYGVSNPNKCQSVRQKIEQTCLRNYRYKNAAQSPIVKMKIQQTNLDRRGVVSPLADPIVREKGKQTSWLVYGTEFPIQSSIVKQHVKESFAKHYGIDHNMKSEDGLQHWKDCFKAAYGVDNPAKCPEIRKKMQRRYFYDNIQFDSAPELALYIWLTDNNICFEYQPNHSFVYECAQKQHLYFPDFKIGEIFVEVKGDHFFKADGTMYCPYRSSKMTDEQYALVCERMEAKHQCMLANNVKILRYIDYKQYLDYIDQTYGKDYLKQFRASATQDNNKSLEV